VRNAECGARGRTRSVWAEFCWPADQENPLMFADKPIMRSSQPSANQKTMESVNAKRGGGSQSGAVSVM